MNKPFLVGVTGGMGAGKSVVCKVFHHLGIPVYDADTRAKWLMVNQTALVDKIKSEFGEESYQQDGQLDKRYLSEKVFSNDEARKRMNKLVHPCVGEDFALWTAQHAGSPYLVKEAALMIESGSYKSLDKLIVVTASKTTRINRVLLRDLFRSRSEIETIIDKQLSDAEFKRHADYVITNNEDQPILKNILALHQELIALGGQ